MDGVKRQTSVIFAIFISFSAIKLLYQYKFITNKVISRRKAFIRRFLMASTISEDKKSLKAQVYQVFSTARWSLPFFIKQCLEKIIFSLIYTWICWVHGSKAQTYRLQWIANHTDIPNSIQIAKLKLTKKIAHVTAEICTCDPWHRSKMLHIQTTCLSYGALQWP